MGSCPTCGYVPQFASRKDALNNRTEANGGMGNWVYLLLLTAADLLNHCTGEQNNYVMAAPTPYLDAFELRTAHVLREGQELCINYGNHTSMQFFLFYGFVPSSRGVCSSAAFDFFFMNDFVVQIMSHC